MRAFYCKNCGNKLPENTRFCPNCGTATEESYPVIPVGPGSSGSETRFVQPPIANMQSESGKKRKKSIFRRWWFWIIIVLVVGSVGRMSVGKNSTKKTQSNQPAVSVETGMAMSSTAAPKPTEKATATPKPTETPEEKEEPAEPEDETDHDEDVTVEEIEESEPEVDEQEAVAEEATAPVISTEALTLRDGKYIIGEDIAPGDYVITCIENDGETIGDMYSSMGDAYSKMGDDDGLGELMNSLGGVMGNVITTSVEILGDYGTVLKTVELKTDESVSITLTEETALQITGGKCLLEPN